MGALTARMIDELGYDPDAMPCASIAPGPRLDVSAVTGAGTLPVGGMIAARQGTRDVAVARLASGRLVIVDDACPHDGGPISDGFVDGEHLVCSRHGWELAVVGTVADGGSTATLDRTCRRACKPRE